MKVTIREVAEAANVSRGTVDRALNHRPGVNPQVAERIIKIADELGYKPDMAARTLANKRYTKTIGVILCSEGNPFFNDVINGVNNALEEMGHFGIQNIVRKIKGFDADLLLKEIDGLLAEKISGLVITPVNSPNVPRIHCSSYPAVHLPHIRWLYNRTPHTQDVLHWICLYL